MVGGSWIRDRVIFASYYNHTPTAHHQPGSGFKQLTSLTALEGDAITPLSFNGPRPHEVKGTSRRPRKYGDRHLGFFWIIVPLPQHRA